MARTKPKSTIAPLMSTARVARVMTRLMDEPWDRQRALRWLKKCDALVVIRPRGRGGHPEYGTTPALFRRRLADLAVEIEVQESEDGEF
ncbi:MAG: hypothetical protein ACWGPR_08620 [Candidatus Deferrimicrobiaceae bacterium]